MTEAQIEARVARMIDKLDAEYLSTGMDRYFYEVQLKKIDDWAFMQRWKPQCS